MVMPSSRSRFRAALVLGALIFAGCSATTETTNHPPSTVETPSTSTAPVTSLPPSVPVVAPAPNLDPGIRNAQTKSR